MAAIVVLAVALFAVPPLAAWAPGVPGVPAVQGPAADPSQLSADAARDLEAGRLKHAVEALERLVDMRPGDAEARMRLGTALATAGDWRRAIPHLQHAVGQDASLGEAWLWLGTALLRRHHVDRATPALQRAVALDPSAARARRTLAEALALGGQLEAAVREYQRALALDDPREAPHAWHGLVLVYSELTAATFARLQKTAPDSPAEWIVRAELALAEEQPGEAISLLERTVAREPELAIAHRLLAIAYDEAGRTADAERASERADRAAKACTPQVPACELLAGRPHEAIALARTRRDPLSLGVLTQAYNALAEDAMERLDELPPSAERHAVRAAILRGQRRHLEAVEELRRARVLAPRDIEIGRALAEGLLRVRAHAEAALLLEDLIERTGGDPELQTWLGDALLLAGHVDDAIARLEAAVQAEPDFLAARASLGRGYAQAGRLKEALPHLEAARPADEDGSVHYQLARAYEAVGRDAEARRALQEYEKRIRH